MNWTWKHIIYCSVLSALFIFSANYLFLYGHKNALNVSRSLLSERIIEAFDTRTLIYADWPNDLLRGKDQYTDCALLKSLFHNQGSSLKDALAVIKSLPTKGYSHCETLHKFVKGEIEPEQVRNVRYDRVWYGSQVVVPYLLEWMSLASLRWVLLAVNVLLYIAMIFLAYFQGARTFKVFLFPLGFGLFFSGLPFYGQSLVHSFAYLPALIFGLFIMLAAFYTQSSILVWLVSLFAGIAAYFFDTAAALPFVMTFITALTYLSLSYRKRSPLSKSQAIYFLWISFLFFCLGVAGSLVMKHAILVFFEGPATIWETLHHITIRAGAEQAWYHKLLIYKVLGKGEYLLYGSRMLGWIFIIASVWTSGRMFRFLFKRGKVKEQPDLHFLLFQHGLVWLWYFIFSNHTLVHRWFAVRYLCIPFAISWLLWWQNGYFEKLKLDLKRRRS